MRFVAAKQRDHLLYDFARALVGQQALQAFAHGNPDLPLGWSNHQQHPVVLIRPAIALPIAEVRAETRNILPSQGRHGDDDQLIRRGIFERLRLPNKLNFLRPCQQLGLVLDSKRAGIEN